jgi:hypothetical protein
MSAAAERRRRRPFFKTPTPPAGTRRTSAWRGLPQLSRISYKIAGLPEKCSKFGQISPSLKKIRLRRAGSYSCPVSFLQVQHK